MLIGAWASTRTRVCRAKSQMVDGVRGVELCLRITRAHVRDSGPAPAPRVRCDDLLLGSLSAAELASGASRMSRRCKIPICPPMKTRAYHVRDVELIHEAGARPASHATI